jgi:hypothetical protein
MSVIALYAERAAALRARERECARRSRRMSRLRLLLAAVVILAGWGATRAGGSLSDALAGVSAAAIVTFIVVAAIHGRVRREQELLGELAALNEAGPARVERRWSELDDEQLDPADADHPYALDLDLTGSGSLSRLFPPLSAALGRPLLRQWLLRAAAPDEIRIRQEAIAELVAMRELRELLAVHAARSGLGSSHVRSFERWAAEPPWWASNVALVWTTRVLPLLTLALLIGGPPRLWLLPIAIGAALTMRYHQRVTRELARVTSPVGVFRAYREMVKVIGDARFTSPMLRELQQQLREGATGAEHAMRSLGRLADSADLRHSGLQYAIVQGLALWDFHVLDLLERWRVRVGSRVPVWFSAIAQMESLAALAMLSHDNPDWRFPRVATDGEGCVRGRALGHPLLPAGGRVANDVVVGPPGTLLFVTGSNMSGKSTLVRALGLNVVLAQAGAAACAEELVVPPVLLHTSMRVQDSLERGVSLFMAEVERLRRIIEAAREASERGGRVLYLLDEVLHGTNSAERTIAARGVLRRLVELGAIGAVTSHDLQLAEAPRLRELAIAVHFREDVVETPAGPRMHFDYRLRPGIATTRNALRLMAEMGLPVHELDRNGGLER